MRRNLCLRSTEAGSTAPGARRGHDATRACTSPDGKTVAVLSRHHSRMMRLWTLRAITPGRMLDQVRPPANCQDRSRRRRWKTSPTAWPGCHAAADFVASRLAGAFGALNAVSLTDSGARLLGARGARFPMPHSNAAAGVRRRRPTAPTSGSRR